MRWQFASPSTRHELLILHALSNALRGIVPGKSIDVGADMTSDVSIGNEIPCFFEEFVSTFSEESRSHEEPSWVSMNEHRDDAEGDFATRQLAIEDVLPDDFDVAPKPRNKGHQLVQRDNLTHVGSKETVYHRSTARHASTVKGGRYRVVVLSKSARHSHTIRISSTCCIGRTCFPAVCLVKQKYQRRPPDGAGLSRHRCFKRGPHLPSTILGTSGNSARAPTHAILLLAQVFPLLFFALWELIHVHSADLHTWLYVLLPRLFIKTGRDLSISLQRKIQKILSIIRMPTSTHVDDNSVEHYHKMEDYPPSLEKRDDSAKIFLPVDEAVPAQHRRRCEPTWV
ncbi:hypothetical protein HPB50_017555 [Hyalomma asiaticum]|uniref:Uncharacterized protein n=1 Tax=Hyalomma asiaticum TaxID=266040 RepID=A0ACB7TM72_HYAAI|nr:hypothetical protein HPB50_017555 [Hyalomma asiaticum]